MFGWLFGIPKRTLSVCLPKDISLSITVIIDPNTYNTTESNQYRSGQGQIIGTIGRQVECGTGIDGRNPDQTSPTDIISGTIMLYIHTIQINIEGEKEDRQNKGTLVYSG
jgi:hypothetical protein